MELVSGIPFINENAFRLRCEEIYWTKLMYDELQTYCQQAKWAITLDSSGKYQHNTTKNSIARSAAKQVPSEVT